MTIGDDFEIQNDGDIRHVANSNNYTVLELHRWLGGLASGASTIGDDNMDVTKPNPSDKSFDTIINLINGYNLDDDAAQYFYGGSVIQKNGDEIYDGFQVLAPAGMYLSIIQSGALATNFWTTGLNADSPNGISHQFMLKVRTAGADIDGRRIVATTREWQKTFLEFKVNGSARGVNVLAFTGWADDLNNTTSLGSLTSSPFTTVALTTAGFNGLDVDNDTVDEDYYSEFTRGSASINQFYERLKYLTRRGETATLYGLAGELFRGITHEVVVDTPTGTFSAFEAISWTGGTGQMLAIDSTTAGTKLWMQLLTGVAPTDGQTLTGGTSSATVDVNVTVTERTVSTPFVGASTGTSIIAAYGLGIAPTDLTAADKLFDLDSTQVQPPNFVTFILGGVVSGEDYCVVGPQGFRFEYDNEASGPFVVGETVTFTSPAGTAVVANVIDRGVIGELVIGPMLTGTLPTDNSGITGGTSSATADVDGSVNSFIDLRQLTLNGALTGAAVTAVVVNETIPGDTPSTGWIRVLRANGSRSKHAYTSWTGSTFSIGATDFSTVNAADDAGAFISYLDLLAAGPTAQFTGVFVSDRSLHVSVRDGGGSPIKPFVSPATLFSSGGSATAVRTAD